MYLRRLLLQSAIALLCAATAWPAAGAIITLSDLNSVVQIDTTDTALPPSPGVFSWQVDGVNQVFQQLWFYSVNGGPRTLVNSLTPTSSSAQNLNANPGNDKLTTHYMHGSLLHLDAVHRLTGGLAGSNTSRLEQSLVVENLSAGPLDLQLFAYADFDVGGDTFNNSTALTGPSAALQTFGSWAVTESVSPGALHAMVGASPNVSVLIEFTLDDLDGTAGPIVDDGTFAFQWNVTLGPGQTITLGRDANVNPVPEPGSLALLAAMTGAGGSLWILRRRHRRRIA
jgi:hypothetical protein